MNELMKIEHAKAVALAFDNSGGVIRADNLHALVESYEEALARLAAAEPQAVEAAIREREEAIRSAAEAGKEIESLRAAANENASRAATAEKERAEALAQIDNVWKPAADDAKRLRAALKLKMSEYYPHDPGFCAACDAGRAALKEC